MPEIIQAEKRIQLPAWNLLLRGFLAGAYIGMGACLMVMVTQGLEFSLGEGLTQLIGSVVFPLGLIIITLTGAELFAGDGMMSVIAAVKNQITWPGLFRLWILVWIGNMAGAFLYGVIMAYGPYIIISTAGEVVATPFGVAAVSLAATKCSVSGISAVLSLFGKAFIAGWLVNIAIVMAICADDIFGKILGIWFPMVAMMATSSELAIANMTHLGAGVLTASSLSPLQIAQVGPAIANLGWVEIWTSNLIVTSVGNLVGALFFALLIQIAYFRSDSERE